MTKKSAASSPSMNLDRVFNWRRRKVDKDALARDLMKEDTLAIVLRGHLYVERLLDDLIGALLPWAEVLDDSRLNFRGKIDLALASGVLLKGQEGPLVALNRLRNTFAHQLGHRLTKEDVDRLYSQTTNPWWLQILSRAPNEPEKDQLRAFVIGVVAGLEGKVERIAELRQEVLQLHRHVLALYAEDRRQRS